MDEDSSFHTLLQRVRTGDEEAAAELVARYEPVLRRVVRIWLSNSSLNRLLDSGDIVQSVLANFFLRAAAGQFDLKSPQQLLRLLETMARNRLNDHARKQQSLRRNNRPVPTRHESYRPAVDEQTPYRIVSNKELLGKIRQLLTEDELYLLDQRASGRKWHELGEELGAQPSALRMKLNRALDRVARQVGIP